MIHRDGNSMLITKPRDRCEKQYCNSLGRMSKRPIDPPYFSLRPSYSRTKRRRFPLQPEWIIGVVYKVADSSTVAFHAHGYAKQTRARGTIDQTVARLRRLREQQQALSDDDALRYFSFYYFKIRPMELIVLPTIYIFRQIAEIWIEIR